MRFPNVITTGCVVSCLIEEVVVTIDLIQTPCVLTIDDIVSQAILVDVDSVLHGACNTIHTKIVPAQLSRVTHLTDILTSGNPKAISEEIHITVNFLPTRPIIVRTVIVPYALGVFIPNTRNQFAIFFEIIVNDSDSHIAAHGCIILKVIPLTTNRLPAIRQLANVGIVIYAFCIPEQASILRLTNVDTVFAKVIVEALDFLDTGQSLAANVVRKSAFHVYPAVLQDVDQRVLVGDFSVGIAEVAACVGGVGRITVGIQTEHCLAFGLLREGVEAACAHVDLVADGAFGNSVDPGYFIGPNAFLGRQLDAVDEAQGICGGLVDHLTLLDPVHGYSQRIGCLVIHYILQFEVFVEDLQFAVIQIESVVKVDGRLNPGQIADTLCQAQKEAPRIGAFHVAAGQHVRQLFQTLGNRNRGHIQRKDVAGNHVLSGINNIVDIAVFNFSIGNLTIPCQLAVAAGGLVEVEAVLALLIQHDVEGRACVIRQCRSDGQRLHAGIIRRVEGHAFHQSRCGSAEREGYVVFVDRDRLTFIARLQGQRGNSAINHIDLALLEVQLIGIGDRHQLGADRLGLAAFRLCGLHQIDVYFAKALSGKFGVGLAFKNAVVRNGRPISIADYPVCIFRHVNSIAAGAYAGRRQLNLGSDRGVIILALDDRMIKCSRAGSSGVHQQVGGNIAGITVGGTVHNRQIIAARLTGYEGSGSAAVQVDRDDTTGFLHDVTNVLQARAGGEGRLTTVNTHDNHAAGRSDTNGGTRRVAVGRAADNLAILHNEFTEAADGLLNTACRHHGTVLVMSTHVGSAVIQNRKEACCVRLRMPFNAVHNHQAAGRCNVGHIEAAGVGGNDNVEVLDVVRALGVAVAILCVLCGAGHRIVLPNRVLRRTGSTAVVVDPHANVVSCYVSRRYVVNDLLAIRIGGVVDHLGDTGGQNLGFGIENRKARVGKVFYIVARDAAHFVCKGVANSLAQLSQFSAAGLEVTGAFKSRNQLVAGVRIVHSSAQILTGAQTIQTVVEQVAYTLLKRQTGLEVLSHHLFQIAGLITIGDQLVHEVIAIQVSKQVGASEGTGRTCNISTKEIFFTNERDLLFQSEAGFHAKLIRGAQKVGKVANPAANVGMVLAALVVVGHVHGAEEVTAQALYTTVIVRIFLIGGTLIGLELLQTRNINPFIDVRIRVNGILRILNKLQEILILGTCHDRPGAGSVVFNAGTHIVQNQRQRIRAGVSLCILLSHHFQIADVGQYFLDGFVALDLYLGNLFIFLRILAAEFTGIGFKLR